VTQRWLISGSLAAGLMVLLFSGLLRLLVHPPAPADNGRVIDQIQVVDVKPPPPPPDVAPPPPPPSAPPEMPTQAASGAAPALALALPLAPPAISAIDVGKIAVPVGSGSGTGGSGSGFSGARLGSGGTFGGFAGGGASGAEFAAAQGFNGKELVALSTARPQIPEWAYKKGISGWVEVVFVVMPNGHVANVRIVNAEPKGVFEGTAVDSISNWIYAPTGKTKEVFQRVEFKLEDYKFNWSQ